MDTPPSPSFVPPLPPPAGYGGYGGFVPPADFQARQDVEHLRLLSIFHYVVGGLTALFGCFGLIYVVMGIIFLAFPESMRDSRPGHINDAPPAFLGWLFAGIGAVIVLAGWTVAALTIYCGVCLKRRQKRTLTLVAAGLNCLQVPFGTALGVFTFVVLNRPSVRALYPR